MPSLSGPEWFPLFLMLFIVGLACVIENIVDDLRQKAEEGAPPRDEETPRDKDDWRV